MSSKTNGEKTPRRGDRARATPTLQSTVVKVKSAAHTVSTSTGGNSDVFVVDKIVDERVCRGKTEYLVKWQNFEDADNTWETASNILDRKLIKEFHDRKESGDGEAEPGRKRKASQSQSDPRASKTPVREKKNKRAVASTSASSSKKKMAAANPKPTTGTTGVFQVEDVWGIRRCGGRVEYFVKWRDFPEEENTWEPADHIPNKKLLKKFASVDLVLLLQ